MMQKSCMPVILWLWNDAFLQRCSQWVSNSWGLQPLLSCESHYVTSPSNQLKYLGWLVFGLMWISFLTCAHLVPEWHSNAWFCKRSIITLQERQLGSVAAVLPKTRHQSARRLGGGNNEGGPWGCYSTDRTLVRALHRKKVSRLSFLTRRFI